MEKRFAYLLWMFPQTSQTFIANEILRVEGLGLPLTIYSCRRPVEKVEHAVVRDIRSPVKYLPDPLRKSWREIWRALWMALIRNRSGFFKVLIFVAKRSLPRPRLTMCQRLVYGCLLAEQLRQDGVKHVHAHFAWAPTDVVVLASMLTGIPFSFTGHAIDMYTQKRWDLREKMRAAKLVVTCLAANLSLLREVAPDEYWKVHLAYHGVDSEKFAWREEEPVTELPFILFCRPARENEGS